MNRKSERGNVIEIVIIVLLLLTVIGLIIWRFLDSNESETNKVQQGQQTTNTETQTSTNKQSPAPTTDPNKGFIVIKEWGVRFKLTADTQVQYYQAGDTQKYHLTTSVIDSLGGNCTQSNNKYVGAAGTLYRTQVKQMEGGSPMATLNGYYYYYIHPQALCSATPTNASVEEQQVSIIADSIKSLEITK